NQQIAADQEAINAAKAKVDAAKMILYSNKSQAGEKTFNGAYNTLKKSGVDIKFGDTLPSTGNLTSAQLRAYDAYFGVLVSLNQDIATSGAAYAGLENYISDPETYGTIGANAITALNSTIRPFGIYYLKPSAINPATAQQNASDTAQIAEYWGAVATY